MKIKGHDTLTSITNSLEAHPFIKGGIPTLAASGIGFIESIEAWLRVGSLVIGVMIGTLTLYLTIRKVLKEHKII